MRSNTLLILLLLACGLLCTHCASEGLPGGGPPDTTPPQLVFSNIETGSILIPQDFTMKFIFSETLNSDQAKRSIKIFPISDNKPSIKVSGKTIQISSYNQWDPDVVYTIILDKGIADNRGNSISQPIQISFTSGEYMPKNSIRGKIFGLEDKTNAYISLSRKAKTTDSILTHPEYYTQSGNNASFTFDYLPQDTFYIAAYIDKDKSNDYKEKFDGICIPESPYIIPDTTNKEFKLQAISDNFLQSYLLSAENLDPEKTKLVFSKKLPLWTSPASFKVNNEAIDTLILENTACTLYHNTQKSDSLHISILHLQDYLGQDIADTGVVIPLSAKVDSFYHVETFAKEIRISPKPSDKQLQVIFQTYGDTIDIVLRKHLAGFYRLPDHDKIVNGNIILNIAPSDSNYSVAVGLMPKKETGTVFATTTMLMPKTVRFVLSNQQEHYESIPNGNNILFKNILPGTYDLAYYIDINLNGRRDLGKNKPFIKPEFLYPLDKQIDVKARWDTELTEPYKIVIENE